MLFSQLSPKPLGAYVKYHLESIDYFYNPITTQKKTDKTS